MTRADINLRKIGGSTIAKRFWPKVDKSGPIARVGLTPCWLWTSGIAKTTGYGRFTVRDGYVEGAHRVSWLLNKGPIPEGLCVLHRCDVRHCVRPGHLFVGTKGDNNRDTVAKGRYRNSQMIDPSCALRGEEHPVAILTNDKVLAIRAAYALGVRQTALAEQFDTDQTNVSMIVNRKTWRHI